MAPRLVPPLEPPPRDHEPLEGLEGPERSSAGRIKAQILGIASEMSNLDLGEESSLLRATKPSSALWPFGRILQKNFSGDAYHLSFQTRKIRWFWSHSWHATSWMKILMLLVYYKGLAALISGNLAAWLVECLFYLGILPGYPRRFSIEGATYDFAPWGLSVGCLVTFLVFLLWQPKRGSVFLDRVCIHQTDQELKRQSILSIGAFLKNSETMLVLFDPTYPTRVWTIFELAAFLKGHGSAPDRLVIRPIVLGPIAVIMFISLALVNHGNLVVDTTGEMAHAIQFGLFGFFVGGAFAFHWLRGQFRSMDESVRQLRTFSLEDANAFCCSVNHVDPSGKAMICDRKIILECVRTWFGSEEHFEAVVRSEVADALVDGLKGHAFSFRWFLGVTLSTLWLYSDFIVARMRAQELYYSLVGTVYLFSHWLAQNSYTYFTGLSTAYLLRRRRSPRVLDYLVSFLGMVWVMVATSGFHVIRPLLRAAVDDDLLGMTLWGVLMTLLALLSWHMWLYITRKTM